MAAPFGVAVEIGDYHPERIVLFVIFAELPHHIQKYPALLVFEYLYCIPALRLNADTQKTILVGVQADAACSAKPQPVFRIPENLLYLTSADAQRIVAVEILVKFVRIILVCASRRTYPDMSQSVFGKRGNLPVGDVGRNNPSGGLHRHSLWLLLFRTGKQQAANQK
jgi:hypothetical protein